jgi:hypothetical protein
MWKKFPPTDWRAIDPCAFNYFSTLLTSRVNIFLYGLNGIGKTKFAKKWLEENNIGYWYVDCLEYYNEKLMWFTISKQLTAIESTFKDSKTFVALKDNLNTQWVDHNAQKDKQLSCAAKIYIKPIYFVLDNVERIISIEKIKKNLEKVFIVADMVAPLVSVLIIHDTYIEEVDAFGKSLFNEYNFTPFVLNPMSKESMKEVIKSEYFKRDPEDPNREKFDQFFENLSSQLSKHTVNLKKWLFLTKMLFKEFCKWNSNIDIIAFRGLLKHISNNFYSNVVDIKDIEEEIEKFNEEKNQEKAEHKVMKENDKAVKSAAFCPNKVTFYNEMKIGNKTSYTFIEAMILCSAFLAAHNKESNDEEKFSCTRKIKKSKIKNRHTDAESHYINHFEHGKTKKFFMERMLTILQFFISNFWDQSEEGLLYHHSINVYSKINTFVSENLFKRSQGRNEDPSAVSLKINYDKQLIDDVMKQFPHIRIIEFMDKC